LDEQATATLRNRVREVQQELYQLLKLRSEEIAQEQERLRREAQYLAQKVVRSVTTAARRDAATSVGSPHPLDNDKNEEKGQRVSLYDNENADDAESTSPTVFVRRRPYVPAMEKTASQDSNASRRVGSGSSAIGVPGREALGQSIAGNVGSYLSASFAMRGRDLPGKPDEEVQRSKEDEEDWFAQKKRLRERYPHADHSALPSAVNSDDEESVAVKARDQIDSSDSEQDQRRGRGRGRQSQQSGHSHVQKTPTPPRTREKEAENGRGKDPKQGLRSMLGSDTSGSFGDDGGSQGGKTMRGALKRTGNVADEQRPTAATEKKVAFASTNVEHDIAPSGRAGERSPSPHEPIAPGDAVFEIDEDLEDDDDVSPTSSEITIDNRAQALEGGADQMIQEALRDEMGEADVEDEESETAEGYAAQEANLKYSLPIAGSFSVLAETESRRASLAAGLTEENTLNFDPASLRFDGRTVYASGTGDSLPVIYSSARRSTGDSPSLEKSALGASAQPLSAPSSRMATKTIRSADMLTGDRLQGSAIGFRVAVGEAEARLSGVLAPHAPSHRGLYAADDRRKRSTEKYALKSLEEDEEDEEGSAEDDTEEHALTKDEASFKHSKGRAISSRGTDAVTTGALLASSVPASAQMMIRRASSAVQRDPTSGFVLEPKTSLPYQEKMLTPSLLKAMRAQAASSQHRSSLAAISDSSDNTAASGNAQQAVDDIKRATHAQAVDMIKYKNVSDKQPDFQYSVPASVTRGFEAAGLGINQVDSFKASTQIPSNGIAPVAPVPHTAVLATMSPFSRSVQSSPMLGSSAGTGRSSRQRSPRPPYIQPPPPSTTDMRLTPDAEHRPQSIALAIDSVLEDGYDEQELLRFMHTVENLKTFKRTGWYHHRIERPESIADHMYRMALLSMLLPDDLDIGRCVQLCIVHDLAEALVGDLTPLDGVSKEEKLRREHDAIQHLVYDQLDGSEMGLRIERIWNEYEDRQTRESKVVKDLDRFELALQAVEYERRNQTADLQPFYSSAKDIEHSRVQGWMLALAKERERLWKQTDYSYQQHYPTTTAKSAAAEDEGDKTVVS
jgi:putative hydrolase of HD superfamily